jgi:hypothetical protein
MLFPVEIRIETRQGNAHDTFWLTAGAGSSGLPPNAISMLREVMERARSVGS